MTPEQIYAAAGLTPQEQQQMPEFIDWNDDFYGSSAFDKLFDYFCFETGEMPYGTAKGRDGMPDEWILERLDDGLDFPRPVNCNVAQAVDNGEA